MSPTGQRKPIDYKPPVRPIVSSYQISKESSNYDKRAKSSAKSDNSSVRSGQSGEKRK